MQEKSKGLTKDTDTGNLKVQMTKMKAPELLAPAGDFEKMKTVIHYGADAVYLGDPRFSLRSKARNFGPDELESAIKYARERGVKVYVTLNIFPHNRDIEGIREHIDLLGRLRPDAVIISDPGVFSLFTERAPDMDIHISTQANITNTEAARFWQKAGAKRLILSRELSIDEIREIRDKTDIELEVFVHGSICMSYSGRCYISSFLADRSANTGECTNSCRWNYRLMEEKRPGEYFPVYEDDRGTYMMSSKDLCLIGCLPLLRDAGINSFKIEGRMKGINYAAGVVKTYREAIDSLNDFQYCVKDRWLKELSMFSSRGYTTGMLLGKQPDNDYNFDGESYRMSHELVGIVLESDGPNAKVGLRNRLDIGDPIEFLAPGLEETPFVVGSIRDIDGMPVTSARNEEIVNINIPEGVRVNDLIRRGKRMRQERP